MKRIAVVWAGFILLCLFTLAVAFAQSQLTLVQTGLAAGGASSGGVYTVRDAVGEPAIGLSSGGAYQVIGGLALGGGAPPITTFTLNVTTSGNGTVTLNPPGGVYAAGTVVQLTATPASGFNFAGWSGAVSGAGNPINVTMDSDKAVTATFSPVAPDNFVLTINQTGNGTVTPNPASGAYAAGTVVQISATPAAGFTFTSWSGAVTGTTNPINVTMDGDKTVTATFTAVQTANFTLTINKVGNGTITLTPPGGVYAAGTAVQISATPDAGFTFSSWSGAVNGATNPITVTMDGNKTVTVTFTELSSGDQPVYLPLIQK